MYAVIETGGKQYRVAIGDKLKVEKLTATEGDSVNLDRVLMIADGDDVTVGSPLVESPVTATVVSHGKKHRQAYTEIEITGIGGAVAAPKRAAPAEAQADKPAEAMATASGGDDLTKINGIGPVIANKLVALDITTFQQIADLDEKQIADIDEQLNFKGRIDREQWVDQAKKLVG